MNEIFNPSRHDILKSVLNYVMHHKTKYKPEIGLRLDNYALSDCAISWYSNTNHKVANYKKNEKLIDDYVKQLNNKEDVYTSDYDQSYNPDFEDKFAIRKYTLEFPKVELQDQEIDILGDILLVVEELNIIPNISAGEDLKTVSNGKARINFVAEYKNISLYGMDVNVPFNNGNNALLFYHILENGYKDHFIFNSTLYSDDIWKEPLLINLFDKSSTFKHLYSPNNEIFDENPELEVNDLFNGTFKKINYNNN